MPPRRHKVDHRRGGATGSKHISSFDEVKARNAGEESAYDKARAARTAKKEDDDEQESEEEEEDKSKASSATAKRVGVGGIEVENPNASKRNEDKEGVELTRKQREELEKQAARRRYEELHKAGKTEEAKADLARLEEVKKRREEAAKKRQEDEVKAKEKEGDKGKGKSVLIEELKEVMGGEETRMRGTRSSKKKGEKDEELKEGEEKDGSKKKLDDGDVYSSYADTVSTKKVENTAPKNTSQNTDGSIEQCREAEADFM